MTSLNIRGVSDETHSALKRQASSEGLSLQRYLLRILDERASQPTIAELLRRARHNAQQGGSRLTADAIADAVRAGRNEPD